MTVVRYTFNVCFKDGIDKDVYTMASELEKAIMKVPWVCGCEALHTHAMRFNSVDVNKVIEGQNMAGAMAFEGRKT